MDSVARRRAANPEMFLSLVRLIRAAGTDNLSHFGNGYEKEGGYSLQQNPEELAALIVILRARAPRRAVYIEIGSASGGVARLLHETVGFEQMFSIDDGRHPRYPEFAQNTVALPMWHLRADSHGVEARDWLREHAQYADVAFIDGDHTFAGAWQDVELVRPFLSPGALVILHDIVAVGEVRRVWDRGATEGYWSKLAEYVGEGYRPLGIAVGMAL